jgi:hypothetical protein
MRRHLPGLRQRRFRRALEELDDLGVQAHLTAASIFFKRSTKNGAHLWIFVSCVMISGRMRGR